MYKRFFIAGFFVFVTCFAVANDGGEKEVVVNLPAVTQKDIIRVKPSDINYEDVEDLLRFGWDRKEWERFDYYISEKNPRLTQMLKTARQRRFGETAGHQVRNFPTEALVFYAAIGASMASQAYMDSISKGGRSDPRWMENFLYELTSPVGLFSFFAFVMASGATNVLWSKWLTGAGVFPYGLGQSPDQVKSRLDLLSRRAVNGGRGALRYHASFMNTRLLLSLGGPLGMSVGMLASNIVHELDFVFFHAHPHRSACLDGIKAGADPKRNSANVALHCDLFYTDLSRTAQSWGPGLFSLVTASFISHALIGSVYKASSAGARGVKVVGGRFLNGAVIQTGFLSIKALAQGALFLIPMPVIKGAQAVGRGAVITLQVIKKQIRPGGLFHRFSNLLGFMLTDTWLTHGIFAGLITEPMTAGYVSGSINNFVQYHSVNGNTPKLVCDPDDPSDCEYHDSMLLTQKTGLSFNKWREFRMQEAMFAQQNWFRYVTDAVGSFDFAHKAYRELFIAVNSGTGAFVKTQYFFNNQEETEPIDGQALRAFASMRDKITAYLTANNMEEPSSLNVNVVSARPLRFLKSLESGQHDPGSADRLFILRKLFSVADRNTPLAPFYGEEWGATIQTTEEQIKNQLLNRYFDEIEAHIQSVKNIVTELIDTDRLDAIFFFLFPRDESGMVNAGHIIEMSNLFARLESEIDEYAETPLELLKEQHFGETFSATADSGVIVQDAMAQAYNILQQSMLEAGFTDVAVLEDEQIMKFSQRYFSLWEAFLKKEKQKISSFMSVVDFKKVVEEVMRKRILSAGLDYVNLIVREEMIKKAMGMGWRGPSPTEVELLPEQVGRWLGPANIFAQLYKETFVTKASAQRGEGNVVQMRSLPQGMSAIHAIDQVYQTAESGYGVDYHSERVGRIQTPKIMDFLLASAVCGPDLSEGSVIEPEMKAVLATGNSLDKQVQEFDLAFPDQDIDDIMSAVPVFKGSTGSSYSFYPPRITNINERDRRNICQGIYSTSSTGVFRVGDKEYNSLLYVVLDHLGTQGVSSVEEFDSWWEMNVAPYQELFLLAAEREYKRIVEHDFIAPLFQKESEETDILIKEGESAVFAQPHSLSQEWFEDQGVCERPSLMTELSDKSCISGGQQYVLSLPKGVFHSIHFEALYLADVILHYAKKEGLSLDELAQLKQNLLAVSEMFNQETLVDIEEEDGNAVAVSFSESGCEDEQTREECKNWTTNFLKLMSAERGQQETVMQMFLNAGIGAEYAGGVALNLNIDLRRLWGAVNPTGDTEMVGHLNEEQLNLLQQEAVGFPYCDSAQADLTQCEPVSVSKQILQYSVGRLNQIAEEAANYARYVEYIQMHPDYVIKTQSQL